MKLSALHQSYISRRTNSFRSSGPLDSSSDSAIKSPAAIFWLVFHGLCCLISLLLGYRFSRLVFFFLFSTSSTNFYTSPFRSTAELVKTLDVHSVLSNNPVANLDLPLLNKTVTNSRVVVGRHGIRIRPWPHPDPVEVMKAHRIIEIVQKEQRSQFGVKNPRTVIVVTPTYVRTFQALHLTGVMHSLMLVPYDLVWIVVEAGGVSNETASLIAKSGLKTIHVGFNQRMPNSWEERHKLESKMRLRALRWIIDPPLEITVPSKRTPWPDAPPELPANEKPAMGIQDPIVKHSTKRTSRSKHRSKRKHEPKTDTQVSTRHSEQN
ncbi:hypothetical protein V6Z12_D11G219400 [Gossypium hirsutum]